MNSGAGRIAKTIVISGLSVVISYLINFFLTPFITDNIGIRWFCIPWNAVLYFMVASARYAITIWFNSCNCTWKHNSRCNAACLLYLHFDSEK